MAIESPDRYLINMSKAKRTGKIFLDYLRNDQFSTAVAPLSPRGRPHAPVSMPLTWAQVKHGLDPAQYTIHTVPQFLGKSKAWVDYCDGERPPLAAIAKLGRQTDNASGGLIGLALPHSVAEVPTSFAEAVAAQESLVDSDRRLGAFRDGDRDKKNVARQVARNIYPGDTGFLRLGIRNDAPLWAAFAAKAFGKVRSLTAAGREK